MTTMGRRVLYIVLLFFMAIDLGAQEKIAVLGFKSVVCTDTKKVNTLRGEIDTSFSFTTPGTIPSGIAWDGEYLWHCDTSSNIYKLTVNGVIADSIPNPDKTVSTRGGAMTFDGENLWLVGEQAARLYRISRSGALLNDYDLPSIGSSDPNGFGIAWDGEHLWHSQYAPPVIYKINPDNGKVLDSLKTVDTILGIEWLNDRLYGIAVYKAPRRAKYGQISMTTGELSEVIDWCINHPLDLCYDGTHLWSVSGEKGPLAYGKMKIYRSKYLTTHIEGGNNLSQSIKIYPNPFLTSITLENAYSPLNEINVFNVEGALVKSLSTKSRKLKVQLRDLKRGIYFIVTKTEVVRVVKLD